MRLFTRPGCRQRRCRYFRKAIDLNHYLSNSRLRPVDNIESLRPLGVLYGTGRFFIGLLYEMIWLPYALVAWILLAFSSCKTIFIVNSKNQLEVANALVEASSSRKIKIVWINGRSLNPYSYRYPASLAYLFSVWNVFANIALVTGARGYLARAIRARMDYYWVANAHSKVAEFWLKSIGVKKVIFSNDHIVWSRAIALAARDIGLETIYIEHAAVSEFFPPLVWSKSCLGGNKSVEAYTQVGKAGKIYRTGMPRFDCLLSQNKSRDESDTFNAEEIVGLAVNPIDNLETVRKIVLDLLKLETRIVIRFHPRDKRVFPLESLDTQYVTFDSSSSIADYFGKINMLIGGDSTILLEAALFGLPVGYCWQLGLGTDYYGFVHENVCFNFSMQDAIQENIEMLKQFTPSKAGLQGYYAPYGTGSAGNSARLICQAVFE